MYSDKLKSLDFQKYTRLLDGVVDHPIQIGIYNAQCALLWSNFPVADDVSHATKLHIRAIKPSDNLQASSFDVDGKYSVFCVHLYSDAFFNIGYIAVSINSGLATINRSQVQTVSSKLSLIAYCIVNEYNLMAELDTMAIELADRYEELNLVYSTEDQASNPENLNETLTRLVSNCANFLDIDAAALFVPDQRICIGPIAHFNAERIKNAWNNSVDTIFECIIETKRSWVYNKIEEIHKQVADIEKFKFAITPINTAADQICGMLAVFKDENKADFTNGDARLLEVMAKKASKIIQTSFDGLTGLINREGLEYRLNNVILSARDQNIEHSFFVLDVHQLNIINDTHGKEKGNQLLKNVAQLLKAELRSNDTVARFGGHKFGVLLERCPLEMARNIAKRLHQSMSSWRYGHLNISVNIGLVQISNETENLSKLLTSADLACEAAIESGSGRILVYESGDADLRRRQEQMQWFGKIKEALAEDRFVVFCQAIVPLNNGHQHYEILLRYLDEENKLISPFAFLPAAERYQLMPEIDRWVMCKTLQKLAATRAHETHPDVIWSINLSGQTMADKLFIHAVKQQLEQSIIPPRQICFEITETTAITNIENAMQLIADVRSLGCHFALDDFGSGLSSFAYLKNLHVDYLKIDGSLVTDIGTDPVSYTMVDAIHRIGRVMNLETIAEFVKDQTILNNLRKIGLDYAQGYEVGMPMSLDELLLQIQQKSA